MFSRLIPWLLKTNIYVGRKQKFKKNRCHKNLFYRKYDLFFTKREVKVMHFHLRNCLLKSVQKFLKPLTSDTFSRQVPSKKFFAIKRETFESTLISFVYINQRNKKFTQTFNGLILIHYISITCVLFELHQNHLRQLYEEFIVF